MAEFRSLAAMSDDELQALLEGNRQSLAELRPYNGTAPGARAISEVQAHSEKVRNEIARRRCPVGSVIQTVVYSIGDRSETVAGEVVGHVKGAVIIETATHGRLAVELSKVL